MKRTMPMRVQIFCVRLGPDSRRELVLSRKQKEGVAEAYFQPKGY